MTDTLFSQYVSKFQIRNGLGLKFVVKDLKRSLCFNGSAAFRGGAFWRHPLQGLLSK